MTAKALRGPKILLFAAALSFGQLSFAQQQSPEIILNTGIPNSQSVPFTGLAAFHGWAVSSAGVIASFTASIDGVAVDAVDYGIFRGDVCALHSGPNCPNVGWSLTVDTTQLSNGTHTLTISAITADDNYATQTSDFVVANWSPASANPMKIDIDSPSSQSGPFSGTAAFSGWATDTTAVIANVSISVDGIALGNAVYGVYRQDVCNALGDVPGCPAVGWNYQLDTTSLSDGSHTLAVTSLSTTGQYYTVASQFRVSNAGSSPIRLSIGSPNPKSPPFSGAVTFTGWALDDTATISSIAVSIDHLPQGNATMGIYRADVCAVFSGGRGCPNIGWVYHLDTTSLSQGSHTLEVTAHASDGRQATLAAPFTVNNGSALALVNAVKVSIDQPSASGAMLTGQYVFSGSALDDNSAITSVQARVDGTVFPVAYGSPSSADCSYDSSAPNCPNAGWSLAIDTNRLPNGSHTLSISAASADGHNASSSLEFNVANWTAANPMILDIRTPNPNGYSGSAMFSGWAIDSLAPISSLTILVDGMNYGYAVYGDPRPDVCNVHPGAPGCPNVGWHASLDTTVLSNGAHVLTIMGTSATGDHSTQSAPFTVSNPTHVAIGVPNAHSGPFSGAAVFAGWAINDNAPISSVEVLVDGIAYPNASYGIYRADVCAAFPGRPGCPNVGWSVNLDTSALANGAHTLQITAVAANNQQGSLTANFNVEQQGSSIQLGSRGAGRILDQATWGPTPSSIETLQTQGLDKWFQNQVAAPISTYPDQINPDGSAVTTVPPITLQFFENALRGQDQLRQRVAFALSEIWAVSTLQVSASVMPPLLRIFANRAFDNYENLMHDVTLNPVMGTYLNMVNNVKGNPSKGTAANENYARELMQLMTIGLSQLTLSGAPVLDSNGNTIPNYSQSDVTNLARALTGWTYAPVPGVASRSTNPGYYLAPMIAVESNHDETSKQFLGTTLPAGNTAAEDLTAALHAIFLQSSMPPFISKQLIQHLVTSNPSPDYVSRVASVFEDNGHGVRGDLSAVVYAILTDPEARAADSSAISEATDFGHLREPVLYVAALARGLNVTLSGSSAVANIPATIGQTLFQPPSVFSYFAPSFETPNGLLAPEFQLYTTQGAANYADAAYEAVYNSSWTGGTAANLAPFIAAAANTDSLIESINGLFLHNAMSSDLRNAIYTALEPLTSPSDKARAALYTVFTSSEYLVIH